ncbi:hypothetical protein HBH56_202010 [Parastagonospora nodorum]|uniref:Wings apart-like protein C-terminal domain-containing protein n=2 Tax=Phaeosphaeria nodorum (strain SN15 / ATCC MYA-4574 / FGSC 10173) TaxID=321614 RepID=A0A7U2I5R7_PHANO|nr:hypothetical protein HBH56_202010 [Parastagonospora nodorum]QRD00907.1 hypothetical protein JI435_094280 [Parastagonospora nodorum SN15]KAH3925704.1 hypothetical protein HBH54_174280 [Parastagonospora nodorum]KAH3953154.1 hypothetical protein HBH53_035650 [Parastagonospora nodorum]KAH4036878.1 hypothetical protein HBI09_078570 [Parastagonospora nodorum]
MSTSMAPTFTAPDRRKKIVTYGKSSRLPSAKTPAPAPSNDAPSPERPRKQSTVPHVSLSKDEGVTSAKLSKPAARDTPAPAPLDIFDVPSDDEFAAFAPTTTKKPLAKRRTPEIRTKAPATNGKTKEPSRQTEKTLKTSHAVEPVKPTVSSAAKKSEEPMQSSRAPPVPAAQAPRRGKTPQPASTLEKDGGNEQSSQPTIAKVKTKPVAQPKKPTVLQPPAQQATKEKPALPARSGAAKTSNKPPRDLDVFDMPPSDDESHLPTPKPLRRVPPVARKEPAPSTKAPSGDAGKEQTGSDSSAAAKKRKRRGSPSSTSAVKQPGVQRTEQSQPLRRAKSQKQTDTTSPGREPSLVSSAVTAIATQPAAPLADKPRRARTRTVPLLSSHSSAKTQSSPATLHSMVPKTAASMTSPIAEMPEATSLEDETMYEIPASIVTPARPSSNSISGSVTPRQKALFGSLLGASSTPSMPSISKLQLADSKPKSLLAGLSKSKSDLGHSAHAKKTRLIAKLKPENDSSDEEASDSESDSESEAGAKAVPQPRTMHKQQRKAVPNDISRSNTLNVSDEMDLDDEVVANTQTSQTTGFGHRPKFTYATQRSYLQEANPDDEFFMSMDMDDPIATASQSRDSQTEDEEDASQARGMHELRRQGQNDGFELENMMLIDDMSVKSTSSIRRTALLELCGKMANPTFTHSLMESSLAQQFLKHLASNGEIAFDFAAVLATVFMLKANPTFIVLDQIRHSGLLSSLEKLIDNENDIQKIAKNRKTNLSKIAYESVVDLRSTALASKIWSPLQPEMLSPQLVALKALDMLVLGLREVGDKDAIITSEILTKLIDLANSITERYTAGKGATDDKIVISSIFSTLEAVSLAKQKQLAWSARMMQRLAASMAYTFQTTGEFGLVTMAVKLCMNLTNNKPKACQQFSGSVFVQALTQSIVDLAELLQQSLEADERTEVLDTLILSLGAMINLTEHSDQARLNVDNGIDLLERLVETFVEGSAKTTQANSMEESQSSVAVGYLSVLVGNLCLNETIKTKVRAQLPGGELTTLVDKIKEFVRVHEHANRKAKQYEGEEGQETWQNYTARIMLVVEQLEMTGH